MFAGHTATRMKGSVVVQGFKSLADKIHPQLPLTAKESSRLLNALTSSFRKHLDEAHPHLPDEARKSGKNGDTGISKTDIHAIHSSAVSAQRHMASVLTNPLMMKGAQRLDYGTAKVELQKSPAKDPVELLEEYDEKGAATVRIAELCLEHVNREYDSLTPDNKSRLLERDQPGRRVFLWLLKSKMYDATSYVDNLRFLDLLVSFLIREGREQNLWQWLKLDIIAPDAAEGLPVYASRSHRKLVLYRYRWRGRLLRQIVAEKVGIPDLDAPGPTENINIDGLHTAMDALFEAVELKKSAYNDAQDSANVSHLYWMPIGAAMSYISKLLTRRTIESRGRFRLDKSRFDGRRYEKLIEVVPWYVENGDSIWADHEAALYEMHHPLSPSADRALAVIHDIFSHGSPFSERVMASLERDPKTKLRWAHFFTRCMFILQDQGRFDDVSSMKDLLQKRLPFKHMGYVEEDMRWLSQQHDAVDADVVRETETTRVPYPSFA